MRILYATSECVPLAKTGGLADVAGAIPVELARRGHEVIVALPLYREVRSVGAPLEETGAAIAAWIAGELCEGRVLEVGGGFLAEAYGPAGPGSIRLLLVEADELYDRDGLYGEGGRDHPDNARRFAFFSRAVIEAADALYPDGIDVVHLNDWQTALIPVYLDGPCAESPALREAGTLITVHNLAYQGVFSEAAMATVGLDRSYFDWRRLEFYGQVNLLKGGLVYADRINTVSPTYAREIMSGKYGCGLEGVLKERADRVSGIVNGVDYAVWDPSVDRHIAAHYTVDDPSWKEACRTALVEELGLAAEAAPLLGMITRLTDQKGLDLVEGALESIVATGVGVAILGTGEAKYHELLEAAAARHPGRVSVSLTFDEGLAHRIEAGCDIYLMPSRYEPCGLNQMYSMRYGTVPVVRRTGGLADTVRDDSEGDGTGFVFDEYAVAALGRAVGRAVEAYRDRTRWRALVARCMREDWSWARSAAAYEDVYRRIAPR